VRGGCVAYRVPITVYAESPSWSLKSSGSGWDKRSRVSGRESCRSEIWRNTHQRAAAAEHQIRAHWHWAPPPGVTAIAKDFQFCHPCRCCVLGKREPGNGSGREWSRYSRLYRMRAGRDSGKPPAMSHANLMQKRLSAKQHASPQKAQANCEMQRQAHGKSRG